MNSFLERLKRRKLVRWAATYLAAAWVALQVVQTLGESFLWLDTVQRPLAILLGFGFLAAVVLAWYHGEKGRQHVTLFEVVLLGAIGLAAVGTVLVDRTGATPESSRRADLPGQAPAAIQLAVLPFQEITAGSGYAAGLHREVIRFVAGIEGIDVRPPEVVGGFEAPTATVRTVGAALAVDYVLTGSVQVEGDQLRITQRLIDTADERMLWSDAFDADMSSGGLFEIQDSIGSAIAEALSLEFALGPSRTPPDEVAYQLYLRSYDPPTEAGDVATGIPLLREAIALDSTFARAYGRMAYLYAGDVGLLGGPPEAGDSAQHYGNLAVQLDPSDASAWFALAQAHLHNGAFEDALRAYGRAQELPGAAVSAWSQRGFLLSMLGRFPEAMDDYQWAVRARPGQVLMTPRSIGESLYQLGELEQAQRWISFSEEHAGEVPPVAIWVSGLNQRMALGRLSEARAHAARWVEVQASVPTPYMFAFRIDFRAGDIDQALPLGEQAQRMSPNSRGTTGLSHRSTFGQALIRAGRIDEGRRMLRDAVEDGLGRVNEGDARPGVRMDLAMAYAGLGESEAAFEWLGRAYDAGWRSLHVGVLGLSGLEPLHDDPRFAAWVERVEADLARQVERVDFAALDRTYQLMVNARSGG